ncbi:MAG: VapC toxin family PIN domain ribonuclease [Methylobacter sp.]|nr:MAG: VapC toxin family PIN domain ribonuclease [Methylobacter sp.]PPD23066.1 MAG: VapC toxin family PIN domain ribonuclease [Methylobacter sp.]PPD33857.1 MAG: VapC toxin family PIN domain ribonuclease [Methylomonas sp.]
MVREKIALDTNVVIDVFNGKPLIIELLNEYEAIYLPVTVCGELLFGAKNSARKQENEQKFFGFINHCSVLNINALIAEQYAKTRKELKDKGRPIPENDIWIAATCIVNNIPLITLDSDFQAIGGLSLVDV